MSDTVVKHRVTMTSHSVAGLDENGYPITIKHEAVDYVGVDILDAYVADAQTRWQSVAVSDVPDYGPGGEDGETVIPENLGGTE